jgi:isopentenyldiphosphate isomerase
MTEEMVDVLDEDGNPTGVRKTKKYAHANGLWHRASHIWIYNSEGELLLQKRSMLVETKPGLWDISAAGHVSAGETPEQGALREMYEEIGIKADPGDIKQIMVRKSSNVPKPDYYDNEFDYIYIFKHDGLPKKLRKGEVDAVRFMPISEFEEELKNPETAKNFVIRDYIPELIKIIRRASASSVC